MSDIATRHASSQSVVTEARSVHAKFHTTFTLFRECYVLYSKNSVSTVEIDQLGKKITVNDTWYTWYFFFSPANNIEKFMTFYRDTFPDATVISKMHFLEEHTVPWLRKWGVGFGLMGEQGAESIHAYFNSLGRTYSSIPEKVQRLKHMMAEHLLHIAPENTSARSSLKIKKLSEE